jgi:hypothetical protein
VADSCKRRGWIGVEIGGRLLITDAGRAVLAEAISSCRRSINRVDRAEPETLTAIGTVHFARAREVLRQGFAKYQG